MKVIPMKIIKNPLQAQNYLSKKSKEESTGFIPSLGGLHNGHVSLIKKSIIDNDLTIVSLFLNPTQFDNKDDLTSYPSSMSDDIELCRDLGVNLLFTPDTKDIYPDNNVFEVSEKNISKLLCGAYRQGHFEGVLTVVLKLLLIIKPERAYFGLKDFQQYCLITDLVNAFFLNTKIIGLPIIRDHDGLALSSRNKKLNAEERKKAPKFYEILSTYKKTQIIKEKLEQSEFKVEYVEEFRGRICAAVWLSTVRLIDNVPI